MGEGVLIYLVRGSLKQLPRDHKIWLLNANTANRSGDQWPQGFSEVRYDGRWEGRIFLPYERTDTIVNAVVAPPTSRQFFAYYQQHGNANPLKGIPSECKNTAQISVKVPPSHKAPSS